MANIVIFCCPKVTNKLGCSCAECLKEMRSRKGSYERYKNSQCLDLVGIINCPGCPSQSGSERIIQVMEHLMGFDVDKIHFTNCMSFFCAFRYEYQLLLECRFPGIEVILGKYEPPVQTALNNN
ncbi:MAG: CGGC domain-containing protein [Clostridiales bacterium]|nr:CGGC domain-containing protein [Eubacteriales bacterium]MDH7566194.1 CGGC domain-containing protein [Clostridiales bacterium]